ncbi:Exostosin-like 3 [Aphelenchoides bicaudatus]|nr:Exostosin-like 3 [Aphelenchoides bicaudatus]
MLGFGSNRGANFRLLNGRFILLFVGFLLGLSCSQFFLFILNFSQQAAELDVDEFCLKQNKWGGLKERLAEQRRIFASVREEHIEIVQRLDESRNELEDLERKIPLKKDELGQLELKIEELKLAARELKDRRNVRLYLPHKPLWPIKRTDADISSQQTSEFKSIEESFDFSRCSVSTRFRVYVYPRETFASKSTHSLYDQFLSSPYRIDDPTKACLFVAFLQDNESPKNLSEWGDVGRNHLLIFNKPVNANQYGASLVVAEEISNFRPKMDFELLLDVKAPSISEWTRLPSLLPYNIKYLISYQSPAALPTIINDDLRKLSRSATQSLDSVLFETSCQEQDSKTFCGSSESRLKVIQKSAFTLIFDSQPKIQQRFLEALQGGSIPVLMSTSHFHLPFDGFIDWRLATVQVPLARLTELHFILRSFSLGDRLEMERKGRFFLENYLINTKVLSRAILSAVRFCLKLPGENEAQFKAKPAFDLGFSAPNEVTPTIKPNPFDDEYLGPVEMPINSASYQHNVSSMSLYAYDLWNSFPNSIESSPEFLPISILMPSGAEFDEETNAGMRPIQPGSGQEFSVALGGNRIREQFTVVILTHNRDAVLYDSLERLYRCPYLNKVIVVWNNLDRQPPNTWPKLHVPLVFIRAKTNSLNNRFLPYDQIETGNRNILEAVLSLDDDIDLKKHEIVFAFRVWRENRDRIVGFPARYHARYGDDLYYNSNHTCQFSAILTGAAFIHKNYFYGYTNQMPSIIREKIDEWMNCEDLAMNFFVSHLVRKPPIKTTSKWTLKCPTCTETLSNDDNHFNKRHNCIRFFIEVYGYNPLLFTQFRVDSTLFKTRLPNNHQKCFRYV